MSARKQCGEALAKEDSLAFTHYLLAQADAPDVANKELERAAELAKSASRGEQLFIEAYRAMVQARTGDAKKSYDELVETLPGDARALVARGQFRQTAAGDLDGAVADYTRATELDAKYPAAYNFLGLGRGRSRPRRGGRRRRSRSTSTWRRPSQRLRLAGAHGAAARRHRRGDRAGEEGAAGRSLRSWSRTRCSATRCSFSRQGAEARRSYAALIATDDPQIHHDGAMREARSWLFDGRYGDGERALSAEADLSAKTKRPGDQADALVELARIQLDRDALAEAGQSLRQARAGARRARGRRHPHRGRPAPLVVGGDPRARDGARRHRRAAAGRPRADEMGVVLKLGGDPRAGKKSTALKGWIAARNGDDKAALGMLAQATRPTLRLAYALALDARRDEGKARAIFDELGRRMVNDLEGR